MSIPTSSVKRGFSAPTKGPTKEASPDFKLWKKDKKAKFPNIPEKTAKIKLSVFKFSPKGIKTIASIPSKAI